MKQFVHVVAGLIESRERILLVEQQGPDDSAQNWAFPGGRVEAGESLQAALIREVSEESGLVVTRVGPLLSLTEIEHITAGLRVLAFTFRVEAWHGELAHDDPDKLIHRAVFLPRAEALAHLADNPFPSMRDPGLHCLQHPESAGACWLFRAEGPAETLIRTPAL